MSDIIVDLPVEMNKFCVVCSNPLIDRQIKFCSKECRREWTKKYKREYYQNNLEAIKRYKHERYRNNREKILEQHRKYYQDNREKLKKQQREYYEKNKEKKEEYRRNNREKIRENTRKHHITRKTHALFKLANGNDVACAVCGCPHEEALTFGHPSGDGKSHRNELEGTYIAAWILKTPIEEVLSRVCIECVYCNFVHEWTGEYPPQERRPKWK